MKNNICAISIVFLLMCSLRAKADSVLFSNYGATLGQGGWGVSGAQNAGLNGFFVGQETQTAESFSLSGTSAYLSQINVALQSISGSNAFLVTLNQNSSGMPGLALEQWVITNAAPFGSGSPAFSGFETLKSTGTPLLLTSGSTYWLVVSPLDPNSSALGAWHSGTDVGGVEQQVNGGGWQNYAGNQGAFSVQGTPLSPVPEPGTFLLLGTGLLGLVIRHKISS